MYKVIQFFHDLQDYTTTKNGTVYHAYNVGETYPRRGYEPSEDRIKELSGKDNIRGVTLIELVEEQEKPVEEQEKPVEEQEKPEKSNKRKAKAEEAADAPEKKAE